MSEQVWVRAVSEADLRAVEGLQGGWWRYVQALPENLGMIFGLGRLLPGEVAGWHSHPEPEIFFVLSGSGEAHWEAEGQAGSATLTPGVAFYKVGHIPHQMRCTGGQALVGVYFKLAPRTDGAE
jgi:quercetin dioxygenase-like cupin family protein